MSSLLLALMMAAPAPLPKPEFVLKSSDLIGNWKMTIADDKTVGYISFNREGKYSQGYKTIYTGGGWEYNKEKRLPFVLVLSESYRKDLEDFNPNNEDDTSTWHCKFIRGNRNKLLFQMMIAYCPIRTVEVTLERVK